MKKTVVVGISGGVDSSVAAYILKKDFNVIGVTLVMHGAPSPDAASICKALDIPHYEIDVRDKFSEYVIKNFIDEYRSARTPNPCVWCNFYLKFGAMLDIADSLGADFIATGHYSRLIKDSSGELFPARALFSEKDQTYALYRLRQHQLRRALFPLGELSKPRVREIAAEIGLDIASKSDSQDICFIPDGDYVAYIEKNSSPLPPGRFIGPDGEDLGEHRGLLHYTVGQRRGLGVAYSERLFVTRLDAEKNEVHLGIDGAQNKTTVTARDITFVSDKKPPQEFACSAKIRYNGAASPAMIYTDGDIIRAEFASPQRGAAPGQSLVLYDGERVIGGGIIE